MSADTAAAHQATPVVASLSHHAKPPLEISPPSSSSSSPPSSFSSPPPSRRPTLTPGFNPPRRLPQRDGGCGIRRRVCLAAGTASRCSPRQFVSGCLMALQVTGRRSAEERERERERARERSREVPPSSFQRKQFSTSAQLPAKIERHINGATLKLNIIHLTLSMRYGIHIFFCLLVFPRHK